MDPRNVAFLLGRLLLGGFFVFSSLNHFTATPQYAGMAAEKGVPAPTLAILGTGLLLLFGGLCILLGVLPRWGLAALALFFIGVTPVMHDFWNYAEPMARAAQMVNFTKNVALLGAVLALMVVPTPWPYGLGGYLAARHGARAPARVT